MALTWDFNEKVGEATFLQDYNGEQKTYTVNLYVGNAYLIFIYEFKDVQDRYSLFGFFADKTHMNRCLGIDKKYKATYGDNMYEKPHDKLTTIRLNKAKLNSTHLKEIVTAFSEAFDSINIQICKEDPS